MLLLSGAVSLSSFFLLILSHFVIDELSYCCFDDEEMALTLNVEEPVLFPQL